MSDEEKLKIEREVYRTIILRDIKQTNIIEVIYSYINILNLYKYLF
jgi:hypothetical protein